MKKITCKYCNHPINQGDVFCSACGKRIGKNIETLEGDKLKTPQCKSIQELQKWHQKTEFNLDIVVPCFFNENIMAKNSFGIYKEINGCFVAYKNEEHRTVLYNGKDEMMAASTLYYALKAEFAAKKEEEKKTMHFKKCSSCGAVLPKGASMCTVCNKSVNSTLNFSGINDQDLVKNYDEHMTTLLDDDWDSVVEKSKDIRVKSLMPLLKWLILIAIIIFGVYGAWMFILNNKPVEPTLKYDTEYIMLDENFATVVNSNDLPTAQYYLGKEGNIYFLDAHGGYYFWWVLETMEWTRVSESKEHNLRPKDLKIEKTYITTSDIKDEYDITVRIPEIYGNGEYMEIHGIKSKIKFDMDKEVNEKDVLDFGM